MTVTVLVDAGSVGARARMVLRLTAAAVAVAAVGTVAVPLADAAVVVAPDSVIAVADPGVTLQAPADGRIAGDGFETAVTGEAIGTRLTAAGRDFSRTVGPEIP